MNHKNVNHQSSKKNTNTMHRTLPQLGDWHSHRVGETNIPRGRGDPYVCVEPPNVPINIIGVIEGKL